MILALCVLSTDTRTTADEAHIEGRTARRRPQASQAPRVKNDNTYEVLNECIVPTTLPAPNGPGTESKQNAMQKAIQIHQMSVSTAN